MPARLWPEKMNGRNIRLHRPGEREEGGTQRGVGRAREGRRGERGGGGGKEGEEREREIERERR